MPVFVDDATATNAQNCGNILAGVHPFACRRETLSVEHPTGETTCVLETDEIGAVVSAAMLRTARKLMDGKVFA